MKFRQWIFLLFVVLQGCGSLEESLRPVDLQILKGSNLEYLQIANTKKETVLLKMGMPSEVFDGGRILVYQLRMDKDRSFRVISPRNNRRNELREWDNGVYSLVLVFSLGSVLEKMSLINAAE